MLCIAAVGSRATVLSTNQVVPLVLPIVPYDYLKWVGFGVYIYVALSYPAIYAEVSSVVGIVCAEFRALTDDFVDDVNTYQLPVVKHYIAAHWKLLDAFAIFGKSLRFIISFIYFIISESHGGFDAQI